MTLIVILLLMLAVLVVIVGYVRGRRCQQRYVTVINETGNIVIQTLKDEDVTLNQCKWKQEIGKFLFILYLIDKAYGLRTVSHFHHREVMATCPWLVPLGHSVHYRRVIKNKFAIEYVTKILYSGQVSPYQQTKVQRMLVAMLKSAADLVEKSQCLEEHMTISIIKSVQKNQGLCSKIYLFSFDIKTVANLGLWVRGEADDHTRILVSIREECFSFKD